MSERATSPRLTILGDRFVLPSIVESAVRAVVGDALEIATHQMDWPDAATVSGSPGDPVREYSGTEAEVARAADGAEALIVHMAPVTRKTIEALPDLKFIAVCRGGPSNVDAAAARERGIRLVKAPGRNANAVAEFTVGSLIAATRSMIPGVNEVRQSEWSRAHYRHAQAGLELCDMTIGLVGYAHIGRKVAKLFQAFGSKILFSDPFQTLTDEDRRAGVEQVSFDELMARADVVSLHARLTDGTRKIMNREAFAKMKRGMVFINNARGELVDEAALEEAMAANIVGMAILDTFDPEPPRSDNPLFKRANVLATPHIAGASKSSTKVVADIVADELKKWLEGAPSANQV